MKFCVAILFLLIGATSFAQTNSISIKEVKDATLAENNFIYSLPYEKGSSHLLVQAYQSMFSHKGEYALDLK